LHYTASGIITLNEWSKINKIQFYKYEQLVVFTGLYFSNFRPLIQCDDTRCCVIQFWPPDDEHMVLETCRVMK